MTSCSRPWRLLACGLLLLGACQRRLEPATGEEAARRAAVSAPGAEGSSPQRGYVRALQDGAPVAYHATPLEGDTGRFRATNRDHGFVAEFAADGVRIGARDAVWRLELALARYGCAGAPSAAAPPRLAVDGPRVSLSRSGPAPVVEWYTNGPLGLEQGFTVAAPPACADAAGAELAFELSVGGDLAPAAAAAGARVDFARADGTVALRVIDLHARDAAGRELPARFEVSGPRLAILVDARAAVYPLEVDPLFVGQQQKLTAASNGQYTRSVALDVDTAVLGSDDTDTVNVFVRSGTTWSIQQTILNTPGVMSVALSGDTLVIGNGSSVGNVSFYSRSASTWSFQTSIGDPHGSPNEYKYGSAVGLDGSTLLVGAPACGCNSTYRGMAHFYAWNGASWGSPSSFQAPGASDTYFGSTVALRGDLAAVGNPNANAVVVYERSGGTWYQRTSITNAFAGFGTSVAVGPGTIVVGATGDINGGKAYVYAGSGTSWTLQGQLQPVGGGSATGFGNAVAVYGDLAVVGAFVSQFGSAHLYQRVGTTWTGKEKLTAWDGGYPGLGTAVAIDRTTVLVGAMGSTTGTGYVYIVNGVACSVSSDCGSGVCKDGYCCEAACTGTCQSCALSGQEGHCVAVANADDPDSCSQTTSTCNGSSQCVLRTGQPCPGGDSTCLSTHCADGYCCDQTCGGGCDVCSLALGANANGTCTVLAVGSPGTCAPYLCGGVASCPTTCSGDPGCASDHYCSSAGNCLGRKAQGGTCNLDPGGHCKVAGCRECQGTLPCVDGYCCDAACGSACDVCNGADRGWGGAVNGTCTNAPAGIGFAGDPACGTGFVCNGAPVCPGGCLHDSDCAADKYCAPTGVCQTRLSQASPCNPNAGGGYCAEQGCRVCAVGLTCTDGYCCSTPCTGACQTCGATPGTCTAVTNGADDACTGTQSCDSTGACKLAQGQTCPSGASTCASGYCADGRCCDGPCDALCRQCGLDGVCRAVPHGQPDTASASGTCSGTMACDGAGACKLLQGQACGANGECLSGYCVDGVCCENSCSGKCQSCNQTGQAGYCRNHLAGVDPEGDCGTGPCKGNCDGAGGCAFPGNAVECAEAGCTDGLSHGVSFCDGLGTCTYSNPQPCPGHLQCAQDHSACLSGCTQDADCRAGYYCGDSSDCLLTLIDGETCTRGAECASGSCSDGVCCDADCNSPCHYCRFPGHVGVCTSVPDDQDPRHECQASTGGDPTCAGACRAGQCAFPDVGTSCGLCAACDGTGRCTEAPDDDATCGIIDCSALATACRSYASLTGHRCASLGACKEPNDPATCTSYTDLACADGGASAEDAGTGPVPGADAGSGGGSSGGCRAAPRGGPGGALGALGVLVALGLGRRRRGR